MKGAEIALLPGRLTLGSGDECDIVLADATLEKVALTLDVGEAAVSILANGEARELPMFEEVELAGGSAFAIGPAEGKWEEVKPRAKPEEKPAAEPEAKAESAAEAKPEAGAKAEESAKPEERKEEEKKEKKSRGCLVWLILMILVLLIGAFLIWYFWPHVKPYYERTRDYCHELCVKTGVAKPAPLPLPPEMTLADIAREYKLALVDDNGVKTLRGDLARRAERKAIVALAYHADPTVNLDLSDPETLGEDVADTLFLVTEGTLELDRLEGRKAYLKGTTINDDELERAIRMLKSDVAALEAVDAAQVRTGVIPPKRVAAAKAAGIRVPEAKSANAASPSKPAAQKHPIAGILTVPYPCVVLRNGERLIEGAEVAGMKIVRIEAKKIVLRNASGNLTEVVP